MFLETGSVYILNICIHKHMTDEIFWKNQIALYGMLWTYFLA